MVIFLLRAILNYIVYITNVKIFWYFKSIFYLEKKGLLLFYLCLNIFIWNNLDNLKKYLVLCILLCFVLFILMHILWINFCNLFRPNVLVISFFKMLFFKMLSSGWDSLVVSATSINWFFSTNFEQKRTTSK